ncbi:hypothetical protein Hte_008838 [Hypoxylon texense]
MSTTTNPLKRNTSGLSLTPPRVKRTQKRPRIDPLHDSGSPIYKRLDPSRREIRLLRPTWSTRTTSSTLEYTLETVSLDDDIQFVALSYVWGDERTTKDIYLNGRRRGITTNLASALLHLSIHSLPPNGSVGLESDSDDKFDGYDDAQADVGHKADPERVARTLRSITRGNDLLRLSVHLGRTPLWVDALCINQDNLRERSQQVQLMRDIYGKAEGVFSWINSSGGKNINLALRALRELTPDLKSHSDFSWMRLHQELCVLDNSGGRFGNKYWNAFHEFENSEYFRRLWIFQELWIGSERVLFVCGDESLPLVSLQHYCDWADEVYKRPWKQRPLRIMHVDLWDRLNLRLPLFEYQNATLSPMVQGYGFYIGMFLSITRRCRCKDARDKVYGLLGVFQMEITPNYEKAVEDVYVEWATDPILKIPPTILLLFSGIGNYPSSDTRVLPSWVPDLELLNDQLTFAEYKDYLPDLPVDLQEHPVRYRARMLRTKGITCFGIHNTTVSKVCTKGVGLHGKLQHFERIAWLSWITILKYLATNKAYLLSDPNLNECHRIRQFIETLVRIGWGPKADAFNRREGSDFIRLDLIHKFSTTTLFGKLLYLIRVAIGRLEESELVNAELILKSMGVRSCPDMLKMWMDVSVMWTPNTDYENEPDMDFDFYPSVTLFGQVIFHTSSGLVGIGPPGMMETDKVYLIHGLRLPVLLREVDGTLVNVGACYIYGISDEASFEILKERVNEVQVINIVH